MMPFVEYRRIPIVIKKLVLLGDKRYYAHKPGKTIITGPPQVICGMILEMVCVSKCDKCDYCRGIGTKVVNCGWWKGWKEW